jgi:hypothetical protein
MGTVQAWGEPILPGIGPLIPSWPKTMSHQAAKALKVPAVGMSFSVLPPGLMDLNMTLPLPSGAGCLSRTQGMDQNLIPCSKNRSVLKP